MDRWHSRASMIVVMAASALVLTGFAGRETGWTANERKLIASLSLGALPPLVPDPSNRVADNANAAAFGAALFADTRLSGDGRVACATCHVPDKEFQDGIALAKGAGKAARRTMPIRGTAYSPWQFWDGRADSQWAQALGPLEAAAEHGTDRTAVAHRIAAYYRQPYEQLFGPLPDLSTLPPHGSPIGSHDSVIAWEGMSEAERDSVNRVFTNTGKAIAAFERTLMPQRTRFDAYADTVADGQPSPALNATEAAGLKLFIGKANCINCHNGPRLTDDHFHNTGVPTRAGLPIDRGRSAGAAQVIADPFNCLGRYSDAAPAECGELSFMEPTGDDMIRAYKTPSLRGIRRRAPYMHAGQYATLDDVIDHYNRAPAAPAGHSEIHRLSLTARERQALAAFLGTLDGE